ncbi:hypothetical protein [Cereibacter johrii]|uniref:hypothetical protein n=1 Tax=Cereibacter johrii TaxID=445629 RepID=UPI003CF2C40F
MSIEALAAQAADLAVKHLVPSAAKGVGKVAGDVWAWITRKAPKDEAPTLAKIEEAPEKASSRTKLLGLLQEMLEENPDLSSELEAMLKEAPEGSVTQTMTVEGDTNKSAQVAGHNNTTTIS